MNPPAAVTIQLKLKMNLVHGMRHSDLNRNHALRFDQSFFTAKRSSHPRRRTPRGLLLLAFHLIGFGFVQPVFAHDPGLSVATARPDLPRLEIHLAMSPTDVQSLAAIDKNHDEKISAEELAAARTQLEKVGLDAFEVTQSNKLITAKKAIVWMDKTGAVQFNVSYAGLLAGELTVRSKITGTLPRGHRQFLSVRDLNEKLLGEQMLDATQDSYAMVLAGEIFKPMVQHSFREFLVLGIRHIATGYDHILFLLGLLIIGGSFKSAVKIITAFTAAHSITLALATMNVINIPPSIIEPLIAVSIIYVGVENILRRNLEKRWLLAFGFGLVHGCGFATALRDLGIGSDGTSIIVPLVSFNLGVEICQMAMAALVLPLIWKLQERPQFVLRLVPASSCAIALAGTWWLLQRTVF